jgi:hypothetical protein
MTDHPVRSERILLRDLCLQLSFHVSVNKTVVGLLCVAVFASGCAERRRPSLMWPNASIVRPTLPPAQNNSEQMAQDAAQEDPAELRLVFNPPDGPFPMVPQSVPRRPRVVTPPPVSTEPSKTQSPFLAPQLTVQESSTAQQQTTDSLAAAEKSLDALHGKTLNSAQSDMAAKVTGFMTDARAAAANGDWTSAQTLARKAQLLAEELAKTAQ